MSIIVFPKTKSSTSEVVFPLMSPPWSYPQVPLSTKPHLLPNYDPFLHQWKLLPWGHHGPPDHNISTRNGAPFLGIFATLGKRGDHTNPQLPLSLRAAFRPVLTAPPNASLLLEAMLLTSGFSGAGALVRGLLQGLRALMEGSGGGGAKTHGQQESGDTGDTTRKPPTAATIVARYGSPPQQNLADTTIDSHTLLHTVALRAVRTATGLLAPETARELKAARRKLGLASLTISERKEKTDSISKAVEARVLIASFVRAVLGVEEANKKLFPEPPQGRMPPAAATVTTKMVAAPVTGKAGVGVGIDPGREKLNARRAAMVSKFEQAEVLREILKPLVDLEVSYGYCAYLTKANKSKTPRSPDNPMSTSDPFIDQRSFLGCSTCPQALAYIGMVSAFLAMKMLRTGGNRGQRYIIN